jgi:hypothetical protein
LYGCHSVPYILSKRFLFEVTNPLKQQLLHASSHTQQHHWELR